MGEHSDLRVRENDSAHEIVLEIALDRRAERFLGQAAPGLARERIAFEAATKIAPRLERPQHGVPGMFREDARELIELRQLLLFLVAAGTLAQRIRAHAFRDIAQEQASVTAVLHIRSKGSDRAAAQLEVEAQIMRDLFGKQT